MATVKGFNLYNEDFTDTCEQTVYVLELKSALNKDEKVYITVGEEYNIGENLFYSTLEEAEEAIIEEYEDEYIIKELDLDCVGYGTMNIDGVGKAVFYKYRGGYTWYVKHNDGSETKHENDYGIISTDTLEEAEEELKEIYGIEL